MRNVNDFEALTCQVALSHLFFLHIVPVAQVLFESNFELKAVLKNNIHLKINNLPILKNQDNSLFLEI